MSDTTMDTSQGRRGSRPVPLQTLAFLGLMLALGILVFVGFIGPDNGVDASSLQQGVGLAAAVAAVPVAILSRPADPDRVVSLGGAMTLAGLTTMFGGNLVGLLMAMVGMAILLVGASHQLPIHVGTSREVDLRSPARIRRVLSLGETTPLLVLASVFFSANVATSSIWGKPSGATR